VASPRALKWKVPREKIQEIHNELKLLTTEEFDSLPAAYYFIYNHLFV